MRFLFLIGVVVLSMNAAFATDFEITSEDCNFEVRKERDSVFLSVNKIIAVENSISRWEIELPKEKIKIPFEDGMKKKILSSSGEEIIVSFKNGVLVHDHKAKSNYTRDTLELNISSDLKHIRSARFTRKGTGILAIFGKEKFECKF
jgi:hypothetical protein